jgi:outer membrane protein
LVVLAVAVSAGAARADSLVEALTLAYQGNPALQQQRAQLRSIGESYVQARAGYRATANAGGNAGANWQKYGSLSPGCDLFGASVCSGAANAVNTNQIGGSLSLSQPLYTSGRATAGVNAAEAQVLSAQEELRRIEAEIMFDVIQAYLNVRFDERVLEIHRQNLAVLQRQTEDQRSRFKVNEVTRTDVAQTEAQLAQGQFQMATAQSQLDQDRAVYAAVVGQAPAQLDPAPPFGAAPASFEDAVDTADRNNPALRSANYLEQAARARVAAARAARGASVSLQSDYQYNVPFSPFRSDGYTRTVAAGVVLQIPLFAGGQLSSQIRQAVEQNTVARTQLELVRRTQHQEIALAWNQLLGARSSTAANREQVRAATIAAEGAETEQQAGLRTTLEVLNAGVVLRNAQSQLAQAERDEYVSAARVLALMGLLEARNLVPGLAEEPGGRSFTQLKRAPGYIPVVEDGVRALDSIGQRSIQRLPAPIGGPIITAPRP